MATSRKKKATTETPVNGESKETKATKFQRLANQRVSNALKRIHQIGNLGAAGYESTEEQRTKIEKVLSEAVATAVNRLNKTTVKPSTFTL